MIFGTGVKTGQIVYSPDDLGATGQVLGQGTQQTETQTEDPASAATEKTDNLDTDDFTKDEVDVSGGKYIPRSRFNEVNEDRKKTKQERDAIAKERDALKSQATWGQDLHNYLRTKPAVASKFYGLLSDLDNGKISQENFQAELAKIEGKMEADQPSFTQKPTVSKADKDLVFGMYNQDLRSSLAKDELKEIGSRATILLDAQHPGWREKYTPGLVEYACEKVKKDLESYHKKRMGEYEQSKDGDKIPKKEGPASFKEDVKLDTAEKREKALAARFAKRS